jgi:hypothetical protein
MGGFALGFYFLWVTVRVRNKTNPRYRLHRMCVGSGCSANPDHAVKAVKQIPGVESAWYNLD